VIVKEARPHTSPGPDGDAIGRLRKEFRLLGLLEGTGIVPRPIEIFQEWEHLFLAEEYIDSVKVALPASATNPLVTAAPSRESIERAYDRWRHIWSQLVRAVEAIHERGVVIADLSPTNVMLSDHSTGDGLRIIDFEAAFEEGVDAGTPLSTPGYFRPRAPGDLDFRRSDWYAVGAVMLATLFPINALLELHRPAGHTFLEAFTHDLGLPPAVPYVIEKLMDTEEAPPPDFPAQALRILSEPAAVTGPHAAQPPTGEEVLETVSRAVDAILLSAEPDRADRLFPADPALHGSNPLSLGWGAAGVLHAVNATGRAVPRHLVSWLLTQQVTPETYPPGLYAGSSGVAWALWEMGLHEVALRTLRAAHGHPLLETSPGIFYGVAGYGLACLHFYLRTGDEVHLHRAIQVGDQLAAAHVSSRRGVCWPEEDGQVALGYGRGAAGISYFLLCLSAVAGDPRHRELGERALDFDLSWGIEDEPGSLAFPEAAPVEGEEKKDELQVTSPYWMVGSAGVGAVALRYHLVTGQPRFRASFDAIVSGIATRYTVFPGLFRGLAGLLDFMVDAYRLTGEERFRERAGEAARGLLLFRVPWREGSVAFPGDGLQRLSMDFGTGTAGVALALHRFADVQARPPSHSFLLDDAAVLPGIPQATPTPVLASSGGHA
jgi:hypothetical protein